MDDGDDGNNDDGNDADHDDDDHPFLDILAICNDIVSIGKIDEIFIDGDTGGGYGDNDDLGYDSKL